MSLDKEIDQLVDVIGEEIEELSRREPHGLYEPIRYILSQGGKRLRPLLALLTYRAFRPEGSIDEVAPVMKAVETFHNFTLLHDDIMDDAPMRRGEPTVYKQWGANVAILSGDAMLVEAYRCLEQVHPEYLARILHLFNQMADGICRGQQYDLEFETMALSDLKIQSYLQMINLKTSALFRGSMMMGATVAGAEDERVERLGRAADLMGLAFQIMDDYLDIYGKEEFGKRRGGDIIERKKTWMLLRLYECDAKRAEEALAIEDESQRIASVVNLYEQWNIQVEALQQVDQFTEAALTELRALPVDCSQLIDLFRTLTSRSV